MVQVGQSPTVSVANSLASPNEHYCGDEVIRLAIELKKARYTRNVAAQKPSMCSYVAGKGCVFRGGGLRGGGRGVNVKVRITQLSVIMNHRYILQLLEDGRSFILKIICLFLLAEHFALSFTADLNKQRQFIQPLVISGQKCLVFQISNQINLAFFFSFFFSFLSVLSFYRLMHSLHDCDSGYTYIIYWHCYNAGLMVAHTDRERTISKRQSVKHESVKASKRQSIKDSETQKDRSNRQSVQPLKRPSDTECETLNGQKLMVTPRYTFTIMQA